MEPDAAILIWQPNLPHKLDPQAPPLRRLTLCLMRDPPAQRKRFSAPTLMLARGMSQASR